MDRVVVDLDARATILDAGERLAAVPPDGDVALVVAPGAPVLRSAVFLEVLRAQAGPRRLSLVTTDARARSLAASVHVPAYASVAALERRELDPTERLEKVRASVVASVRAGTVAPRPSLARVGLVAGSLAAAAAVLAAVLVPEARVYVAATAAAIGPAEVTVRGTTGGSADVTLKTVTQGITGRVPGTATGVRTDEVRAKGSVQLSNKTTDDFRVPKGTVFRTGDGVQFVSQTDVTLPRSVIVPPFELFVGKVSVGVEAAAAGPSGNVVAGRITVSPDPNRFSVTNPEPAGGGEIRRIPVARLEDYDAAVKKAPDALKAAGDEQLQRWLREPRPGETVVPQVLVRQTSVAPSSVDVIGKESFELMVSGIATAYVSPEAEPRRAIAARLQELAEKGNDVDVSTVRFDVNSLKVADDGVTWSATARGQQTKRVDRAQVAHLLTGRLLRDQEALLRESGVRWVRTEWTPAWWPLLPLLDARISVQVGQ